MAETKAIAPIAAVALLLLAALLGPGCGGGKEEAGGAPPERLAWEPVPGADRYVVRAWSGYRLLFEEGASDTTLILGANLQRTLAAFDSVEVEVRAERAAGAAVVRRMPLGEAARETP